MEDVFGLPRVSALRERFAQRLIAQAGLATDREKDVRNDLEISILSGDQVELHFPFLGLEQTAHWDGTWEDIVNLVLGQIEDWAHDIQAEYERFGPTEWHSQD